jgi:hypothetical protein
MFMDVKSLELEVPTICLVTGASRDAGIDVNALSSTMNGDRSKVKEWFSTQ